jgi:plastocyanin
MKVRAMTPVAAIAAAGALLLFSTAAEARTSKVQISSNFYAPFKVTVKQGDKLRFVWDQFSFDAHDVNVKKGPAKFHSPLQAGGTWTTKKLKKPGKYTLFCSQHPEEMRMTLTVKKR